MYEKQFYLKSRPFVTAPYAPHYYPARSMHQALGQLKMCLERASGVGLVIGQPGIGKSMLLVMLTELLEGQFKIVPLACSRLEQRAELLQSILFELGEPYRDMSEGELRLSLIDYLRQGSRNLNGIVLLVDDAHTLSSELLEELHSMTSIVRDGLPRCRMVLSGNASLEEKMTDPRLESLNQCIAARCALTAFSRDETSDYVRAQMNRAGAGARQFFTADALIRVHQLTDGVPRLINVVCDHALLLCASLGSTKVETRLVEQAWSDVQRLPMGLSLESTQSADFNSEQDSWTTVEFGELADDVTATPAALKNVEEIETNTSTANIALDANREDLNLAVDDQDAEIERQRKRQGYYWTLTGDYYHSFNEESAASEIERLTREQEELVSQVESLAKFAEGGQHDSEDATPELAAEAPSIPAPRFVQNPFDEDFESEEPVLDTTIRYSLRHNRSATELTMLQLSTAECWTEEPFSLTESGVTPTAVQRRESEWSLSDHSSTLLQDMSADAIPLNSDSDEQTWNPAIPENGQNPIWFSAGPMATQTLPATDNQPEEHEPEPTARETIRLPIERSLADADLQNSAKTNFDSPVDDRDMLIVSRVNQYPSGEPDEPETPNNEVKPSTGKAIRLDYRELFERLRNGGDDSNASASPQ